MSNRYTPHVNITLHSPNKSSRQGASIQLIVIHSTESDNVPGLGDLQSVGNYLCRPATQASSHVITDNEGNSCRLVPDSEKAWHCAEYNRISLGIEQIGRAAQTHWTRDQIRETARWVARWNKAYRIPIRVGEVSNGRAILSGIVTHSMLGVVGGGHHDPGSSYPLQAMLNLAKFYRAHL